MISERVHDLEQENIKLKEQVSMLENICGDRVELPRNCEYCLHFIQHYIKSGGSYYPTCSGTCAAGSRVKGRKVSDTCKAFEKRQFGKNFI